MFLKRIFSPISNIQYPIFNIQYSLFIILFALTSMYAWANKEPNEFSIYLGGGLSSIHHQDAPRANFFNGYAVDLGVGYTYFFHANWGIYFGAGAGIYNTQKTIDMEALNPNMTDINGHSFDLYTTTDYSEAFQTLFLNVPFMLQYQSKQNVQGWRQRNSQYRSFYAMGGVKVGVPFKDSYESQITTITNSAYYPDLDNWATTQRFAGLGTFDDGVSSEGELKLAAPSLRLALEAGLKWRLKGNMLLYTGVYCDFGFNNTARNTRMPINNHIAVDHLTDFTLITFSEKVDMMTAGIMVRLAFLQISKKYTCPYNPYRGINETF